MKENYGTAYKLNAASIYLYKSTRKNAKCSDSISVNHLISHAIDKKICDERIKDQFISTIGKVVYYSNAFNKHLEMSVYADIAKDTVYNTGLSSTTQNIEFMRFYQTRIEFNTIEKAINYIFTLFYLIYPYNTLSLENDIYKNTHIKALIRDYYHN